MGYRKTEPDQRGAWTPFVGVALASLTAGSLILFSFVAQRTSLDGFTAPGIRAASPASSAPRSITLPAAGHAAGSGEQSDAGPLSTLAPTAVVLTPPDDAPPPALSPDRPITMAVTNGPQDVGKDAPEEVAASWSEGGESRAFYRDARLGDDSKSAREDRVKSNGNGKAPRKQTGKDARKDKKNKKAEGHRGKSKAAGRKRGHSDSSKAAKKHHGRSAAAGSSGSSERSRSAASSRPAPSSRSTGRPQKASKPAPQAHPGHSNTKGKGHSTGRGRGHGHD